MAKRQQVAVEISQLTFYYGGLLALLVWGSPSTWLQLIGVTMWVSLIFGVPFLWKRQGIFAQNYSLKDEREQIIEQQGIYYWYGSLIILTTASVFIILLLAAGKAEADYRWLMLTCLFISLLIALYVREIVVKEEESRVE